MTDTTWVRVYNGKSFYCPSNIQSGGNMTAAGAVTASATSDLRMKEAFDYGVDYRLKLLALGSVVDFNYNALGRARKTGAADDRRHTGVIWQQAVNAGITGFCSMDEDGFGSVNPICPDLIFTILGAVQQNFRDLMKLNLCMTRHETELERLKRENREMRARIEQLENINERRIA